MAFHMGFSPSPYILSHIFLQLHSTIMYYDTFFSVNPDGTRKLILVNKKEKKWIRRRHNEPYPSKQSNQSKFSKGNIGKIILIYIYIYTYICQPWWRCKPNSCYSKECYQLPIECLKSFHGLSDQQLFGKKLLCCQAWKMILHLLFPNDK